MMRQLLLLMFATSFSVVAFAQDDATGDAEVEGAADAAEGYGGEDNAEGERCISTRSIRNTTVLDDQTIIFEMRGGTGYINNLRNRCNGLARERRFSYNTTAGRLCNVDQIRVIESFGGSLSTTIGCSLGMFYEASPEEIEILKAEASARRGGGMGMGGGRIETENPNAEDEAEDGGELDLPGDEEESN